MAGSAQLIGGPERVVCVRAAQGVALVRGACTHVMTDAAVLALLSPTWCLRKRNWRLRLLVSIVSRSICERTRAGPRPSATRKGCPEGAVLPLLTSTLLGHFCECYCGEDARAVLEGCPP